MILSYPIPLRCREVLSYAERFGEVCNLASKVHPVKSDVLQMTRLSVHNVITRLPIHKPSHRVLRSTRRLPKDSDVASILSDASELDGGERPG